MFNNNHINKDYKYNRTSYSNNNNKFNNNNNR